MAKVELEKPSEKSSTPLKRSLMRHRNGTFRAVLAFVYWPNLRSKLRSDPFSDSFRREILGNSKYLKYKRKRSPLPSESCRYVPSAKAQGSMPPLPFSPTAVPAAAIM